MAYYDYGISTGPLEGTNNKIKLVFGEIIQRSLITGFIYLKQV
jgi:transposase